MRTPLLPRCLLALIAPIATFASWVSVADFESFPITQDEAVLQGEGWIFQDYDFLSVACHGAIDCGGQRAVVTAPFSGEGKALRVRAIDPSVEGAANARSVSAFSLPEAIALNDVGTLYLRFALENTSVSPHWGLTENDAPQESIRAQTVSSPDVVHDFDQLRVNSRVMFSDSAKLSVFGAGGWEDAGIDSSKSIVPKTWYEVWYHIHNRPESDGGGRFDVYIRGGDWTEITHLGSSAQDVSSWAFRDRPDVEDGPLVRFVIMLNAVSSSLSGAAYFDDIHLFPGAFSLERASDPWAGFNQIIKAAATGNPAEYHSEWFGTFRASALLHGWIWHQGLAWLYAEFVSDARHMWFWSLQKDQWVFTSDLHFPYLWVDGAWHYYWSAPDGITYLYDFRVGAWVIF